MRPITHTTSTPARLDLRERLLRSGVQSLADADLVAVLLGTGTLGASSRSLAFSLLDQSGGLRGLTRLGAHALAAHRGIGEAKAARIVAALELGHRTLLSQLDAEEPRIDGLDAVARWARPRLCHLEHEEVWLLCMDGRQRLKATHRVARGGMHGCALMPRDVLRPALRDAASGVVLVHNHPSGDPTPSVEDLEMTRALARACGVVGLTLLDHVVVARSGSSSIRERGGF